MKQQLIKQFTEINQRLYREANNPLRCHGVDHHLRVLANADHLVKKLSANVDESILIPACLLHDISCYVPDKVGQKEHHQVSRDMAEIELKRIDYPKNKIGKILEVIASHGTDHKPQNEQESVEAMILRDADKIETAGALGVARIIMAETRRDKSLEEIAEKWLNRIDKKFDSITLPQTKNMTANDYKYAKEFFEKLTKQLKNG